MKSAIKELTKITYITSVVLRQHVTKQMVLHLSLPLFALLLLTRYFTFPSSNTPVQQRCDSDLVSGRNFEG